MQAAEFRWSQVRVGLFLALAGIVLFAGIVYVGLAGTPFARHHEVKALFADVSGLAIGSPVEMGGVVVGEITGIELPDLQTGLMEVTLGVKPEALERLGASSVAYASSHALVGQRFIGLVPRQLGEPRLEPGATIQSRTEQTIDSVVAEVTLTLKEVRALAVELRDTSGALAKIGRSLTNGEGTLGRLVADDALYTQLQRSLAHVETMTERLSKGDGALAALTSDPALGRELRSSLAAFSRAARSVESGNGVLGRLVHDEQLGGKVGETLANLQVVSNRLVDAQGTLGALISDPALLGRMDALVGEMDSLVSDVRRNPARYLRIQPF
jgi:phospholipid/cholesterol/gamma-HCH transport system substrate-binding protein